MSQRSMPLIDAYQWVDNPDPATRWEPVRRFALRLIADCNDFEDWTEELCDYMRQRQFSHAWRLTLHMEVHTLLALLTQHPATAVWSLGEVYYRISAISRLIHSPMHTDLVRLHSLIRQSNVYPDQVGLDPFVPPVSGGVEGILEEQPGEDEPYRRIQIGV